MTGSLHDFEDLFHRCLEMPSRERAAYLDGLSLSVEKRRELERLLEADSQHTEFLEPPELDLNDSTELKPGTKLGPYRVDRCLARGGMGSIFLAHRDDLEFERTVAIKTVKAEFKGKEGLETFRRERQTLARLNHPNVARLFDGGTTEEGLPYLVMELIDGLPIDRYCDENELSPSKRLTIFRSVLRGVDYAHRNLIIHRDLKPNNILVEAGGTPKLLDFGVSEAFGERSLDRATPRALTPGYASPEQVRGDALTTASDVYSLGIILYRLLSGERPSEDFKKGAPCPRIRSRAGRDMEAILHKALAQKLEDRYATVHEFESDLNRYEQRKPVAARSGSVAYASKRALQRHPIPSALVVIVAIVLLAWGVDVSGRAKRDRDRLAEILRLSDLHALNQRIAEAKELPSAHPDSIHVLDIWVREADRLLQRRDLHAKTLSQWQTDSVPRSDSTPLTSTHRAWRETTLDDLVKRLDQFATPTTGLFAQIQHRLEVARVIEEETIDNVEDLWVDAIEEISDPDACPPYDGLEIEPQVGLIPLGVDPESELYEFYHFATGEMPERDDDGALILGSPSGIVLVLIPGGRGRRGADLPTAQKPSGPYIDSNAQQGEIPSRAIEVEPFFMSKFELTRGQWKRLAPDRSPGAAQADGIDNSDVYPAENMTYEAAREVLASIGLTLPTEDQWEYAARAGTTTPWWTGRSPSSLLGAANILDQTARDSGVPWAAHTTPAPFSDGYVAMAPAFGFRANPFGLHHIAGNVMEWCQDAYDEANPKTNTYRGGSYGMSAAYARSSCRAGASYDFRAATIGIRPVRPLDR